MARRLPYSPDDFTQDGLLKVGPLLWLIIIYLSRHLLIVLIGRLSQFLGSGQGVDTSGLAALYSTPEFMVASVPAGIVLVAHFRRISTAKPIFRALWRKGRWLLGIAASLDLLILVSHWSLGALEANEFQIAAAFIDAYIMMYLVRSKRTRDTFEDFPASGL